MLATNHVLAGSVLGTVAGNPLAGFALGVASHLVMDVIPHWGVDTSSSEGYRKFLKVAVTDGLLLLALGGVIVAQADASSKWSVGAGAFGALLPDLDKPWQLFFGKMTGRTLWPAWFNDWNSRVQKESPRRWWVEATGFICLGALVYVSVIGA